MATKLFVMTTRAKRSTTNDDRHDTECITHLLYHTTSRVYKRLLRGDCHQSRVERIEDPRPTAPLKRIKGLGIRVGIGAVIDFTNNSMRQA